MKIGLTYTGYGEKHQNYVKWLKGNNPEVEVIKLSVDGDKDAIRDCDGFVLSGGVDIHPEMYGGTSVYTKAPKEWKKDRDQFEQSVFEFALERKLPVIGVCRGLQLINVLLKGTLIQDLGEKGDLTHEYANNKDQEHPVTIEEGSLLFGIAGVKNGEANSAHHQAIDKLGEGLRVNCHAEDGTIEGIEWMQPEGKSFLLAVQWHPERMYTNHLPDAFLYKNIRERFVHEIKKNKK
ncbi:gamma-glutamyl-gamma-aminobutyrate hydrolase family protein [Flavitalea flava]